MIQTMRAMAVTTFAPDARPRPIDFPMPEPRAGEAVVRMAFASVNPADWKCAEGWLLRFPQFKPALPFGLGFDGAGVVAAVGPGDTDLKPGDRVFVRGNQMNGDHGTFATHCRTTVDGLAKLPDGVSLRDAATVPTAGLTAWQSLMRAGELQPGQSVLVNGGAGGTGGFAVQLAKAAGARVAATCGADNVDYVCGLGAGLVQDYRQPGLAQAIAAWSPGGVDLLLDTVNLAGSDIMLPLVRPGGVLVAIETLDLTATRHDPARAAARGVRLVEMTAIRAKSVEDLMRIGALMAEGKVRAPQTRLLPLDKAADALAEVKAGHVRGKLLLEIGGEPA
ncbi:MAG: alcohol dehydrogenase [Caulobacter sp.]|nr:alcohol dehydrogenase [Caulobacter sp.]